MKLFAIIVTMGSLYAAYAIIRCLVVMLINEQRAHNKQKEDDKP